MRLSVVMAARNEAGSIVQMLDQIAQHAPADTEILLVDSSTDNTATLAEAKGARVIRQKPQGHGMALKYGINQAEGDIILTMDCDLTYPIDYIPKLIALIRDEGYDLVSGCRLTNALKHEMPYSNLLANRAFAWIVRTLYGIKTFDVTTGMFAMKRELAQTLWRGNYSLPAEIIIRCHLLGKKYLEVPIPYHLRMGESTLPKWRSGKSYLRCFCYWKWGWFAKGEL